MTQSTSFWMANFSFPPRESLQRDEDADVCVVGAGIIGLTCAFLLSQAGKKVVVLEAQELGKNESARTTGHLTNVLDDRFDDLERLFGKKGTHLAVKSHAAAIDFIEMVSKNENIDCSFERVNAFLFAPPNESNILKSEYEAAKRAGLDVETISRVPIVFDTGEALQFGHQAQFFPLRYLEGLAKCIERNGGKIYPQTVAQNIEEGNSVHILTQKGNKITAKAAVIATNVPINNRVLIHTKQAAYRTYVLAGKIPQGSVPRALYYDTLDPYHYVRLATDPHTGDEYLIAGGEDHRTGQCKNPEIKFSAIEEWTRARFPSLGKISHKWSGQIIEPVDSLAFLGKNPMSTNVYVGTGDSGNGLTHGTLGAILIADLILGKENAWEKLYKPSRINLFAIAEFMKENLNTLVQYGDWFAPGDVKSEDEIPHDSGAIVCKGTKKIACYKDSNGELKSFSAVCPHLKGIVRWNSAEKTWDCPCHGSRFSGATGKKINGPANTNLNELK